MFKQKRQLRGGQQMQSQTMQADGTAGPSASLAGPNQAAMLEISFDDALAKLG